jgi:DNA-binding Lrp family transcriptional regulator
MAAQPAGNPHRAERERGIERDADEYGIFMRDVLRALPGVRAVESMLSLREVKRDTGLPLI